MDDILIHYQDPEARLIGGIDVNRLDTYNAQIQDFTIFKQRIAAFEDIATIQSIISSSLESRSLRYRYRRAYDTK